MNVYDNYTIAYDYYTFLYFEYTIKYVEYMLLYFYYTRIYFLYPITCIKVVKFVYNYVKIDPSRRCEMTYLFLASMILELIDYYWLHEWGKVSTPRKHIQ